jgi:hypothetical protein
MHGDDRPGLQPGETAPRLTPHPLGSEGQLSPGPDDLRPSVPRERRQLERDGWLEPESDPDEDVDSLVETVGVDGQIGLPRVF